ncbi:MAG: pilus assembly protein PilM [Gammaproteobacteria bacterium]|nr:MAG: pilus assembly protein PilM [Gammaproteobacteria bacterium]
MLPFRKKDLPFVGIDISTSAVKLLELSKQGDLFRVESFGVAPLLHEGEKNESDIDAYGNAVKLVKNRSGTSAKLAAVAVPVSAAITKRLTMPAGLNDHEMLAQIELEADQHIPYPLNEVSLDFDVLGNVGNSDDEVNVMLAVARTEEVNRQAEILTLGGFEPKVVDIEIFAIERSFQLLKSQLPNEGEGMTVAVIDIGATLTTLYVIQNEEVVYYREQVFGGRQLTEEIQSRYGISYAEAGRAKKEGGLPDNYVPEVLTPFVSAMTQQISRSLNYFYSSGQSGEVNHIILAGGCASIPGVLEQIEMETGISVSIANPFTKMTLAASVSPHTLSIEAPSLLTACGLAMRRYDGHN